MATVKMNGRVVTHVSSRSPGDPPTTQRKRRQRALASLEAYARLSTSKEEYVAQCHTRTRHRLRGICTRDVADMFYIG